MTEDQRPFELEPERDEPEKTEPEKTEGEKTEGEAASEAHRVARKSRPAPSYEDQAAARADRRVERGAASADVDARTVAERRGQGLVPRGNEQVPAPADWPAEAFSFPLRAPGGMFILVGVAALVPLDAMGVTALAFVGYLLKLLLVAFILRAQIFVIASSAAGRDVPSGWQRALDFDADDLGPFVRTLLVFVLLLAPGSLVLLFGNVVAGLLLLGVGSMYASVVALGAALQVPSLKFPWTAFAWMGAHPLPCLAGSIGWWLFVLTEASLQGLGEQGLLLLVFLSIVLRGVCFYGLLVSARFLGVMGRSWSPGGNGTPPESGPESRPEDASV